jgi:hypothetical protein
MAVDPVISEPLSRWIPCYLGKIQGNHPNRRGFATRQPRTLPNGYVLWQTIPYAH